MSTSITTRAVHAGEPHLLGGAVAPIVRSTVNHVPPGSAHALIPYPRLSNQVNHTSVAAKLADLEGAEAGLLLASGMAAISTALLAILAPGDELLIQRTVYGGTHSLVHGLLAELGIHAIPIDPTQPGSWVAGPRTRAIYVESLSNPLMAVPELEAVLRFARAQGLISLIDNTFATPVLYPAAARGFDLVLHSATKYLNGHSDVCAGAVVGRAQLVAMVLKRSHLLGGSLDPQAAWLLGRGMKTLPLRVRAQCAGAEQIARFLADAPGVERVYHPSLPASPHHLRATRLLSGFGGMVSFELADGPTADRFLQALGLFFHGPSLGGVESLATRPTLTTHASMSAKERADQGIRDGLIRLSVGIEDPADLLADLAQALAVG